MELTDFSQAERAAGQSATDAWEQAFREQGEAGPATDHAEVVEAVAGIAEQQYSHEDELLAMDNVVGVCASRKVTDGKPTTTWSLTVLVEQKLPKQRVPKGSQVPTRVGGVPTDVIQVGLLQPLTFNARVRPALPGFSIGHFNITAGTFGCLVRDVRRCDCGPEHGGPAGDHLILSNNHVLANVNRGNAGDLILQPGPFDGGVFPADGVATLERFEPIVFGFSGYNLVDAAVARPTSSRNVTASIIGQVVPRGIDQAFVGGLVIKVGRTTQVTRGRVLAVDATIGPVSGYTGGRTALFRHQIITTSMSAGGDSGSLLMDQNLNAVGLLFAGSPFFTVHNHIADVESALGVRPVTAPRSS